MLNPKTEKKSILNVNFIILNGLLESTKQVHLFSRHRKFVHSNYVKRYHNTKQHIPVGKLTSEITGSLCERCVNLKNWYDYGVLNKN